MAAPLRRLDPSARSFPSRDQPPSRLLSLPPSVSRFKPVPSGWTRYTCSFIPPPGATVKASHAPSGDHSTKPTGSSNAVRSSVYPPAASTVQSCGSPPRLDTTARRRPSGEKEGELALPIFAISDTVRSTSSISAGEGAAATAAKIVAARITRPERFMSPPLGLSCGADDAMSFVRGSASPLQRRPNLLVTRRHFERGWRDGALPDFRRLLESLRAEDRRSEDDGGREGKARHLFQLLVHSLEESSHRAQGHGGEAPAVGVARRRGQAWRRRLRDGPRALSRAAGGQEA